MSQAQTSPMVYSHCSKCGGGHKHHHRSSKRKESGHVEPSYYELYFKDSKQIKQAKQVKHTESKKHVKHTKQTKDDEAQFGGICRNCS